MNKKLIAAAVSAAVIAPVAAQAESSFYASIRNVIDLQDTSGEGTTDLTGVASRFGFKGNADLGNGMTAHGRYEFSTHRATDKESAKSYVKEDGKTGTTGVDDIRIATVGLSGSFGRVDIGNQWSSFFNTFGTLVSPTYTLGYYMYSSIGGGAYRGSNTIKYSNTFGPLYAELDVRLNESNEGSDVSENLRGEGIGLGLSYSVTDNITIAAAFDNEDREGDGTTRPAITLAADTTAGDGILADLATVTADDVSHDEERVGIAVKATFGNFWGSIGWQNKELDDTQPIAVTGTIDLNDDGDASDADETGVDITVDHLGADVDTIFLWVGGSLGDKTSWMIGHAQADDGIKIRDEDSGASAETDDSSQTTWGIYHNMGGGMKLFYEATSLESENNGYDGDRHMLGMRVDF